MQGITLNSGTNTAPRKLGTIYWVTVFFSLLSFTVELAVGAFLVKRAFDLQQKFFTADLVILILSFLLFALKMFLAVYSALYAFSVISSVNQNCVLHSGLSVVAVNVVTFFYFVIIMIGVGFEDPTGLTACIVTICAVVTIVDTVCTAIIVYYVGYKETPRTYAYYPVVQLIS